MVEVATSRVIAARSQRQLGALLLGEVMVVIWQGSLNQPIWEDQTLQIYGNPEGFPLSAMFGLVI